MPDPLILIDPVQQNDFTARAIAFPNDPLPGNLVDGEFAHIRSILGVAVDILQGITSPDGLSIGQVIGIDQLTPGALDALAQTVVDAVAADTSTATGAAVEAAAQAGVATAKANTATAAATAAVAALTVIEGAQAATVAAIEALTPSAQASADSAEDSASAAVTAKEAAEVASTATLGLVELAGAWAEHMPGTIPPDVLAAMAITGDHWSARWWANQAAQIVSAVTDLANNAIDLTAAFNKIYLGPKVEDPSLDNENQPLLVGALYWNELDFDLRVWTGENWTSATGSGGFLTGADNLGGGVELFKDRVTGVLNFRTITVSGGIGVTQAANEIQLTIDSVAWARLAGKPTTLDGYGIADAYTKAQIDAELDAADAAIGARATIAYVNSELDLVDAAIATKADAAALGALTTDVAARVVRTSATGSAVIPAGTTAQRDGAPGLGNFRFNSTLGQFEGWNGAVWVALGADLANYLLKSGGTLTGSLIFQDDLEGVVLSRGGKLTDQNAGGGTSAGRTILWANSDSFDVISEDGNTIILSVALAAHSPSFKGNLVWHDANPNLAGMVAAFERTTAPTGWLKSNGAVVNRTTYANLDAAIYCGDGSNATAEWGYRTNSTDTVRSTTGTHIKLRDWRGEFLRGWDDGRGVDSGRSLWLAQAQSYQSHTHSINDPGHNHSLIGGPNAPGSGTTGPALQSGAASYGGGMQPATTGITINATGGTETRPRNQAALICIKY